MATGAFLCGTRQAGKTNLSKIIVDYLLQQGVVVHIIDASKAWLELSHLINVTEYPYDFVYLDVDFAVSQVHDMSQLGYKNHCRRQPNLQKHIRITCTGQQSLHIKVPSGILKFQTYPTITQPGHLWPNSGLHHQ